MRNIRTARRLCSLTALLLGATLPVSALAHPQLLEAGVGETLLHHLTQADHLLLVAGIFVVALLVWRRLKRQSATSAFSD